VRAGVAFTQDRSWASIGLVGASTRGGQHWQVSEFRPDTGWVIGRLPELIRQLRPCAVVVDQPAAPAHR
jgi:hypothetical protein